MKTRHRQEGIDHENDCPRPEGPYLDKAVGMAMQNRTIQFDISAMFTRVWHF